MMQLRFFRESWHSSQANQEAKKSL